MENANEMVTVDAGSLRGQALNWMMIRAIGHAPMLDTVRGVRAIYRSELGSWVEPNFEQPAEVADLIEEYQIGLERPRNEASPEWRALTKSRQTPKPHEAVTLPADAMGPTHAIAAARALVISKFGDKVEVPAVLTAESPAPILPRRKVCP